MLQSTLRLFPLYLMRLSSKPDSLWACLYIGLLILLIVVFGMFFYAKSPLIIIALLLLTVATPLILKSSRLIFWTWLLLFPTMYFDPLTLSNLLPGLSSTLAIAMFLMLGLPGTLISLIKENDVHLRLLPVSMPLWFIIGGFLISLLHFSHLFRPEHFARNFMATLITIYLLTVGWHIMSTNSSNIKKLYLALLWIGILNALAIILQYTLQVGLVNAGGFDRPVGLFGFPVMASFISLLSLVLALYGYFCSQESQNRLFYIVVIFVLLGGCFMSMTKTNILQLIPLFITWLFLLPAQMKRRAIKLVLSGFAIFLFWEILADHGYLLSQLIERFSRTDTLSIRQTAWHIVISNMDLKGFLFGHGWLSSTELLGVYNYNYSLFPVDLNNKIGTSAIHPHNAYLKYSYEMGILGAGMLLSYLWIMIKALYQAWCERDYQKKLSNIALGSIVMALLISCLSGSPMSEIYSLLYVSTAILLLAYKSNWLSDKIKSSPLQINATIN